MPTCDPIEGIIERVDEFCWENLVQEVAPEMREAVSRRFVLRSKPLRGCFRQSPRRRQ